VQFAWSHEYQRRKSQRAFSGEKALVSVDGAEQARDTLRLDNRGIMLFF
jgi:hypothetical protein